MPLCGSLICVWETGVACSGVWCLHGIVSILFLILLFIYGLLMIIVRREREFNGSIGYYKHAVFPDIVIMSLKIIYAVMFILSVFNNVYVNGAISCILLGLVINFFTKNYYYHNGTLSSLYIYCLSLLFLHL